MNDFDFEFFIYSLVAVFLLILAAIGLYVFSLKVNQPIVDRYNEQCKTHVTAKDMFWGYPMDNPALCNNQWSVKLNK